MSKKLNYLKVSSLKDGSIKIKISDGLYEEEFNKVKDLYELPDEALFYFKNDALKLILVSALQGYIENLQGDAKNDYWLRMDGELFHVIDGRSVYDEEDIEEDMGEDSVDSYQVTNIG